MFAVTNSYADNSSGKTFTQPPVAECSSDVYKKLTSPKLYRSEQRPGPGFSIRNESYYPVDVALHNFGPLYWETILPGETWYKKTGEWYFTITASRNFGSTSQQYPDSPDGRIIYPLDEQYSNTDAASGVMLGAAAFIFLGPGVLPLIGTAEALAAGTDTNIFKSTIDVWTFGANVAVSAYKGDAGSALSALKEAYGKVDAAMKTSATTEQTLASSRSQGSGGNNGFMNSYVIKGGQGLPCFVPDPDTGYKNVKSGFQVGSGSRLTICREDLCGGSTTTKPYRETVSLFSIPTPGLKGPNTKPSFMMSYITSKGFIADSPRNPDYPLDSKSYLSFSLPYDMAVQIKGARNSFQARLNLNPNDKNLINTLNEIDSTDFDALEKVALIADSEIPFLVSGASLSERMNADNSTLNGTSKVTLFDQNNVKVYCISTNPGEVKPENLAFNSGIKVESCSRGLLFDFINKTTTTLDADAVTALTSRK